ncbi:MAG: hypothetical protein AKCLJLPJ_02417 [Fimbriimonadales bacterium]|nr:MAG: DUF47 family protein [Armatimonadota bacterium]MBV6504299.1 hypothetical protein [Fimbriimonadales bacterium]MCE7900457.1 DUF47 family protein [Armatimonadetes bacterium ATM1]MDL1928348.1 DUF47 family protein [Fimbriimonadia bacterium ATM]MBC6969100.1 DUF47 family protein [Armatimonadota bacterium]
MRLKVRKEGVIYDLFEAQARVATQAAEAFLVMARDPSKMKEQVAALEDIEHDGDRLTHELQNLLAGTFITPLDKEDLKELSQGLDDITDHIEAAAARAELYRLTTTRTELVQLAELLRNVVERTESAVHCIRRGVHKSAELQNHILDIHSIENESDQLFRTALRNLFDSPNPDPLEVMKWKELFDRIESAIDKCEHIAAIIGTFAIKYA